MIDDEAAWIGRNADHELLDTLNKPNQGNPHPSARPNVAIARGSGAAAAERGSAAGMGGAPSFFELSMPFRHHRRGVLNLLVCRECAVPPASSMPPGRRSSTVLPEMPLLVCGEPRVPFRSAVLPLFCWEHTASNARGESATSPRLISHLRTPPIARHSVQMSAVACFRPASAAPNGENYTRVKSLKSWRARQDLNL